MELPNSSLPHGEEVVLIEGNTENPKRALILLHGRGGTAANIISLDKELGLPDDVIVVAPQASRHTWYPDRFLVPQSENQPNLDSALDRVDVIIKTLHNHYGIERSSVALLGFSQGACLSAEYVKRQPARYLAVAICSGGLIGDDLEVGLNIPGSLLGTPVYVGCDEMDFHIPRKRVEATAAYLSAHEAAVKLRLYQGLGHTIHEECLDFLRTIFRPGR
jgi:predicted esterase